MIVDEEAFLEHYGKKGMKWGIRNERRLQRAKRVASGKGSKLDKVGFALTDTSTVSIGRHGSVKGAAKSRVRELQGRKRRMNRGTAGAKDILALLGGDRLWITGKH